MLPDNPTTNLRDQTPRHTMLLRECNSAKWASQDVSDAVVGEFGVAALFPTRQRFRVLARMVVITRRTTLRIAAFAYKAHGYSVSRICAWRRPLKILKPVISFDAVDVIDARNAIRWITDESARYQLVYESELQRSMCATRKPYSNVPTVSDPALKSTSSVSSFTISDSPDVTGVRNGIPGFPANNWTPFLLHTDSLLHASQN